MRMLLGFIILFLSNSVSAACVGKFLNPITSVCWKCMFPLAIAGGTVADPNKDKNKGTPPPVRQIACTCPPPPYPYRIGIPIGFWEPARAIDVVREPFCFLNLGGVKWNISSINANEGDIRGKRGSKYAKKESAYQVHFYIFPLLALLNIVTNMACYQNEMMDIAYLSEFDPTWDDEELSMWTNPEAILFKNPLAIGACIGDCVSASSMRAIDQMFWCSGCQGNVYPLTGLIHAHNSGIEASQAIVSKTLFKLHRYGLLHSTMGPTSLCKTHPLLWWKKTQYKSQIVYPQVEKDVSKACHPIGKTAFFLTMNKEYPIFGEDFGYLIWRRRECCAF
ncbi:MAG: TraU family protein [Gammaproteobacteria bacterium]